jgi:hypothetical protein
MEYILSKERKRASRDKPSGFRVRKQRVPQGKIDRYKKDHPEYLEKLFRADNDLDMGMSPKSTTGGMLPSAHILGDVELNSHINS